MEDYIIVMRNSDNIYISEDMMLAIMNELERLSTFGTLISVSSKDRSLVVNTLEILYIDKI